MLRVDDLARAAGTTTRNVRLYQERGLLPPPERSGRVGLYNDAHLGRLRLITRLLERGYSLANIGELLATWESGRDLTSVLGVEQVLTVPWNDEDPAPVTLARLREALGPDFDAAAADRLVSVGLLQRQDAGFTVPSPDLLRVAGELVQVGLPLSAVLQLAELLVEQLTAVARGFVVTVSESLGPGPDEVDLTPAEVERMSDVANRLRPLAAVAVNRAFSVTMDRETIAMLGARLTQLGEARSPDS